MNKPTWSPEPKLFGSIEDVKNYCIEYMYEYLFKYNLRDQSKLQKEDCPGCIDSLTFDEFSYMCRNVIEQKSCELLLKLASGKLLKKSEIEHLCYEVPAYIDDSMLLKVRPNYPLEFARNEKVSYSDPVGEYTEHELHGIKYRSKPSEDRIRHFRLSEVYYLVPIIDILGPANDHRYTELEILGIIFWIYLSNPEKYYLDIFLNLLHSSKHGLEFRARIKPYSVSIKRWPTYWLQFVSSTEPYTEVESIFGYVISEVMTDEMLDNLDSQLDIEPMYYYLSNDDLMRDIDMIIDGWVNTRTRPIKDMTINDFFLQWDLWTTSGAASDVRVVIDGSKPKRIHKSSLPLFVTVDELYAGRLQPSRVSIKAETGKARLVFSAPTYDSLCASYFLYKYDTWVQNSNVDDYFSMSQEQMLNTSADIITKLDQSYYMGSSDIEKNDWIQNVVFDCYVFVRLIEKVIRSEDIELLLDLCSRSLFNWVFVPNIDYNSRHKRFSSSKGTHLLSTGGLITGQRRTTLYNGFCNRIGNSLGMLMVERTLNKSPGYRNLFGGDDSIQIFHNHTLGALSYIATTSIFLKISPLKSYISQGTAEYFRVGYSKAGRHGYSTRVIHSIIAANPVSLQEIDLVLKCKSMYDTLQIYFRRHRTDNINVLFKIYYSRLGINETILNAPTSAGGCGLGLPNDYIISPGVPRYKPNIVYKPSSSWFSNMIGYLNPESLSGVTESYIRDMSIGVIDREATKDSREHYKLSVDYWLGKVKFKDNRSSYELAKKAYEINSMVDRCEYITYFSRATSSTLVGATASWQNHINEYVKGKELVRIPDRSLTRLISDVINRAEMEKVSDKINYLKEKGWVIFSNNVINRLPGKVLLDLVLGPINGNGMRTTVPSDMHFIFSILGPYQQTKKLSYMCQSVLASFVTLQLYSATSTHYSQLLGW